MKELDNRKTDNFEMPPVNSPEAERIDLPLELDRFKQKLQSGELTVEEAQRFATDLQRLVHSMKVERDVADQNHEIARAADLDILLKDALKDLSEESENPNIPRQKLSMIMRVLHYFAKNHDIKPPRLDEMTGAKINIFTNDAIFRQYTAEKHPDAVYVNSYYDTTDAKDPEVVGKKCTVCTYTERGRIQVMIGTKSKIDGNVTWLPIEDIHLSESTRKSLERINGQKKRDVGPEIVN